MKICGEEAKKYYLRFNLPLQHNFCFCRRVIDEMLCTFILLLIFLLSKHFRLWFILIHALYSVGDTPAEFAHKHRARTVCNFSIFIWFYLYFWICGREMMQHITVAKHRKLLSVAVSLLVKLLAQWMLSESTGIGFGLDPVYAFPLSTCFFFVFLLLRMTRQVGWKDLWWLQSGCTFDVWSAFFFLLAFCNTDHDLIIFILLLINGYISWFKLWFNMRTRAIFSEKKISE